jgi:hypothetical protein
MPNTPTLQSGKSPPCVPAFWPMTVAAALAREGTELLVRNLKFVEEEIKIHGEHRPQLATPNVVRLDLRTMILRDYGRRGGIPTVVDPPYAGHTAMIADYQKGQSLVETLLANGVDHVALTDWKSATDDMKDFDIDNYLAELIVAIDDREAASTLSGFARADGCRRWRRRVFPRK